MKSFTQWINENKGNEKLDLTGLINFNKNDRNKAVQKNYPDGLIYKGHNFFDKIYMNVIISKAEEIISERGAEDFQECYLGYEPYEDFFICGFDIFETQNVLSEDIENTVKIFVTDKGVAHHGKSNELETTGFFYDKGNGRDLIERVYPNIVHIRLD